MVASILRQYFLLLLGICYEIDKTAAYLTLPTLAHMEDTDYQHYQTPELPATTARELSCGSNWDQIAAK